MLSVSKNDPIKTGATCGRLPGAQGLSLALTDGAVTQEGLKPGTRTEQNRTATVDLTYRTEMTELAKTATYASGVTIGGHSVELERACLR